MTALQLTMFSEECTEWGVRYTTPAHFPDGSGTGHPETVIVGPYDARDSAESCLSYFRHEQTRWGTQIDAHVVSRVATYSEWTPA